MNLPLGYRYAAAYAGIRKTEKDDLGLIVSDAPASAAAVFTQNVVQASPVKLARKHIKASRGVVKAVLVNAGNANCATRTGDASALVCCEAVAQCLKVKPEQVIPASTGVIGVELDSGLITQAIPKLVQNLARNGFADVAGAIMTTDTVPKTSYFESGGVRLAGMTKGAGMIHPDMATTLGFVMTDAKLAPAQLKTALRRAIAHSYNQISVDGDQSTNDMVIVLANGASGRKPVAFEEALGYVLDDLAQQIVRDGEGARKLITIRVEGAVDDAEADKIARSVANSPLVKTAIAGSDPNWGRILAAAGYSGAKFKPEKVDIYLQHVLVCQGGVAAEFPEEDLKRKLDDKECSIHFIIRGKGQGTARFWTCDLTEKYIDINGSYRT